MIDILHQLPKQCYVAVSGGLDSMAVLHFLRANPRRDIRVLTFNHGTEFGKEAEQVVVDYCFDNNIRLYKGRGENLTPTEEAWRNARYEFFKEFEDRPIITAHHLNDQAETYLFYMTRGSEKYIPYRREPNIIRPFLNTPRAAFEEYAARHNVPYLTDPANSDQKYARSIIRYEVLPNILRINPGFLNTVKGKFMESERSFEFG